MAKVLQVIDVDSEGFKVRLDDGRTIRMPHGGPTPHIGEEVSGVDQSNNLPVDEAQTDAPGLNPSEWLVGSDRRAVTDSTDEPFPLEPAGD